MRGIRSHRSVFKKAKLHTYDTNNSGISDEYSESNNESDIELDSELLQYHDIFEAWNYESDEEFDGFQ